MIAAVVLAAGLARRMGRQKLVLAIDGKPIVRRAVEGVIKHVDDTVIVTGPNDRDIAATLAGLRVRFVVNPHPEAGQATSIASGIGALGSGIDGALVVLGDQPKVPPEVVPALLEAFRRSRKMIVAPAYQGVQGTPVLFRRDVFTELAALTGDAGAKSVVQRDPTRVEQVPFDVPMPIDIDTPDDYERIARPAPRRP
jgi:molybdenum cofactor cytidylyltransferase